MYRLALPPPVNFGNTSNEKGSLNQLRQRSDLRTVEHGVGFGGALGALATGRRIARGLGIYGTLQVTEWT